MYAWESGQASSSHMKPSPGLTMPNSRWAFSGASLAWAALTFGLTAWAIGEAIWTYYEVVLKEEPFPSVADAAFLLFPLASCVALLVLPGDDAHALGDRVLESEHALYPHAVRLIAEREKEIRAFRAVDYWRVFADLSKLGAPVALGDLERERRTDNRQRVLDLLSDGAWHSGAELEAVGGRRFGARIHELRHDPDNPRHIQLRTDHELWLKERSINLAAMRLPPTWKYLAWIDADCTFARFDWANETLHALQHYPVVQMWSQLLDLNPDSELAGPPLDSFGKIFCGGGVPRPYTSKQTFGCPGLAWAADRSAWDQLGGLFDYTILGAGDWYFAACVSGTVDKMIQQRNDFTPAFRRHLDEYYARVEDSSWKGRSIKGNVGCVLGAALHRWHGHKKLRQYATRGRILRAHNFDPGTDLKPDWQGLYQLTNRKPQLRRDIAKYFMARNEDSE